MTSLNESQKKVLKHLRPLRSTKLQFCIKCERDYVAKKSDEDRAICRRCMKKTVTLLNRKLPKKEI